MFVSIRLAAMRGFLFKIQMQRGMLKIFKYTAVNLKLYLRITHITGFKGEHK